MHMRVSKLVYLPVGGVLAAGLLTSAFVLPQPKLAAAQDCYGVCASATSLSLSRSAVSENTERLEEFSVRVGAGDGSDGVPTGTVTVEIGPHVVCRAHLSAGRGECSLAGGQLAPGSYELAAHYGGDANFRPSTSREERLTVLANSGTELSLSRSRVTVSREWVEEFKVKVYEDGHPGVRPAGSVALVTDDHVVCRVHLSDGQGDCSLQGWQLHPGSYEVEAQYSGDATVNPSTSRSEHFTVIRG